ncbi:hypothetical protein [uncultured Dialister sp.]|jgi:hypothetical protein|uniref:hypothetical protein n=1 Tax=uncultured Dialister sp. TaxID=278064 RepID=UPI0026355A6C|nr:hypothetical protein [uncultured Dialister sp.]
MDDITKKDNEQKEFCMDRLMEMLQKVRPDVASITPAAYVDGALEEVEITFSNGFSKTVNVACDAPLTLVRDVIKAL